MYREILTQLEEWKEKENRKILFLAGAKGVGKSWTLADFGAGFYGKTVIFDLKSQDYARFIFEGDLSTKRILKMLSVNCGENIEPEDTFIVLENIDVLPNYVKVIDLIYREMKEYHIAITTLCNERRILAMNSGLEEKTDVIFMYPLSFSEFLRVNQEDDLCVKIEENSKRKIDKEILGKIKEYLKVYMLIGGMPEVVKTYIDTDSIREAEAVKSNIIFGYLKEFESVDNKAFSKKIIQVWESVSEQLSGENKKFQYGAVRLTARAREYKEAVDFLVNGKYVSPLYRVSEPLSTIERNRDEKSFELFFNDIGFLSSIYGLTFDDFENEEKISAIHNGAIIEQFVFEELMHNPNVLDIGYWVSGATAKIEFVFEDGDEVIPVEINLFENPKAQSLKVYRNRYKNEMSVRISMDNMSISNGILTLPLFAIWNL